MIKWSRPIRSAFRLRACPATVPSACQAEICGRDLQKPESLESLEAKFGVHVIGRAIRISTPQRTACPVAKEAIF
jgi:hypothetical protein